MFNQRPSWFYGLLVAALVGPYALLDRNMLGNLWSKVPSLTSLTEKAPAADKALDPGVAKQPQPGEAGAEIAAVASFGPTAGSNRGAPTCDIPDAFRFDVTPQWIT